MNTLVLCSLLMLVVAAVYGQDKPNFPCDPKWPRAIFYPDYSDCSKIWRCEAGVISSSGCASGEGFDFLIQKCVSKGMELISCKELLNRGC